MRKAFAVILALTLALTIYAGGPQAPTDPLVTDLINAGFDPAVAASLASALEGIAVTSKAQAAILAAIQNQQNNDEQKEASDIALLNTAIAGIPQGSPGPQGAQGIQGIPGPAGPPGANAPTCPCSIWTVAAVPPAPADLNESVANIGMRFTSDVPGLVYGVRFYKVPFNNGQHIGYLWTAAGVQLGAIIFQNETASGWQQASFPKPIAIQANTPYIVSYYAPNGHYSITPGYFSVHGVDTVPLHSPQDSAGAPNGAWIWNSQNFPSGPGLSGNGGPGANYWVDVVFATQ